MAELTRTSQLKDEEDELIDAAFEAETPAEKQEVTAPKEEVKSDVTPEAKAAEPKTEPAKVQPKPAVKPPVYAKITEEDLAALKADIAKAVGHGARIEELHGRYGTLNGIVTQLQKGTPKGQAVELPTDVVSELEAEFPELAGGVKAALTKALKNLVGTGTAKEPAIDLKSIETQIETVTLQRAREDLDDAHPNWMKIVGAPPKDGDPIDQTVPYRVWLAKQPDDYQAKINATQNAAVIARSIDKFIRDRAQAQGKQQPIKKVSPKIAIRKNRIAASLQPRGDGGHAATATAAQDPFEQGFAEEYQQR